MAGSKVYLRSQSGRVENFDQFRARLRKLGTSDSMRFREVRNLLMKEAQPLVTAARQAAYEDSLAQRSGTTKQRGAGGSAFRNLYSSIGKWKNKGNKKAYVVVGLLSQRKKGAYYAPWQLFGGTAKNFEAKDFIGKAVDNTSVVEKAQTLMQRHLLKRITSILR
jgi:hypothetical protein